MLLVGKSKGRMERQKREKVREGRPGGGRLFYLRVETRETSAPLV
jgi:hypothetical protein